MSQISNFFSPHVLLRNKSRDILRFVEQSDDYQNTRRNCLHLLEVHVSNTFDIPRAVRDTDFSQRSFLLKSSKIKSFV